MIYLTGDTHNDFSKLSNKSLKNIHSLLLVVQLHMIFPAALLTGMIRNSK